MNWKMSVILTLSLLVIIFVVQNFKVVEVHFLLWSFTASRALVLLTTLVMGFVMGWAAGHLGKKKTPNT
jgi:uncharacterized integral membrane protein